MRREKKTLKLESRAQPPAMGALSKSKNMNPTSSSPSAKQGSYTRGPHHPPAYDAEKSSQNFKASF